MRRVWNDSATSVPSRRAIRPCSIARPAGARLDLESAGEPLIVAEDHVRPVDVGRQVDAHTARGRLDPQRTQAAGTSPSPSPARLRRPVGPPVAAGSPGPAPGRLREREAAGIEERRRPARSATTPPGLHAHALLGGRKVERRRARPLDARPVGHQRQPVVSRSRPSWTRSATIVEIDRPRERPGPTTSPGRPGRCARSSSSTCEPNDRGERLRSPYRESAHVAAVHADQGRPADIELDRRTPRGCPGPASAGRPIEVGGHHRPAKLHHGTPTFHS